MGNNRVENAKRNIVSGLLLKLYQIFMPFVMRTVIIYLMGVQYVGLNSLFISILQVLNLAELGVGNAMVFSMYKPIVENNQREICALLRFYRKCYLIIGLVIAGLGIVITPVVPRLIKSDVPPDMNIYVLYLINLGTTVMSYLLFSYKGSLLHAHQRVDVLNKIQIISDTFLYIVQIAVLFCLRNYYVYVLVALVIQCAVNFTVKITVDKMYPQYKEQGELSTGERKAIEQRIKDLFTSRLGTVMLGAADTIVISAFLGLKVLAVYQNYFFIVNAIYGVIMVIFNSIIAGIGNSLITESVDKNYKDFKMLSFIINWISTVCCCCFLSIFQPFMKLWVGNDLMLPDYFVVLFVVYFYVCVLAMIWATVKDAAGIWHADRFRPLAGAFLNLILNIILVNCVGLPGILLSTIISYILVSMPWLLFNIFKLLYKRSVSGYLKLLLKYLVATVLSCAFSVYISSVVSNLQFHVAIKIVISLFICFLISNGIQIVFFIRDNEYQDSVILVKKLIGRR